ncbi:unnamed protein product [Rotaria socialis]|uniref:Uncharacterized protein n=1 Tax=Rotaria socialis TaxID=392032 RepID=A0A821KQA6_9BILA|nr:unnamed protein product [Rotaria socialis]CAF3390844.1 unnamed protein product [Rotaria socialis]CAF3544660.1 unnamed protein product [Rotaria socialis]CAF4140392.1 unnamed protein product [Rotaria socialis]CAF4229913.1 unnamed protein product [Rotaria socialis]
MFILTSSAASFEIIYGIRTHSNALIADGLYSFAEGLCLIGVMLVLHYSDTVPNEHKHNTFGYERSELLFGLVQEVFLLSISLGVIVDAVNNLFNPVHVHDPKVLIILGVSGVFIGILGMIMFRGYLHNHDIKEEINEKRKREFLSFSKKHMKNLKRIPTLSNPKESLETPLMIKQSQDEITDHRKKAKTSSKSVEQHPPDLDAFAYENVDMEVSRVYATLHALCLHSFVIFLEPIIVIISGLMIHFIPQIDSLTGNEINVWLKYVDPILTLIMVILVAVHAIPVILSISAVLIENVPDGIDTQKLMNEIITAVPAIKSIHSFHIWRATPKEIYASLHIVCDEDTMLSTCTNAYGKDVQKVLNNYCIRYFTLQFEYATSPKLEQINAYDCAYGLYRKRRGHTLDESMLKLAKDAIVHI